MFQFIKVTHQGVCILTKRPIPRSICFLRINGMDGRLKNGTENLGGVSSSVNNLEITWLVLYSLLVK